MNFIEEIGACVPTSAANEIPWERIENLLVPAWFSEMKTTCQNPSFHAEGDVFVHTQKTVQETLKLPAFYELPKRLRTELFLAAILHDVGKIKTTRLDVGVWTAPHHASTGAQIVREFLWKEIGLCGTEEALNFRETVWALTRYHMKPIHLVNQPEPEAARAAREIATVGELAKDFSWRLLCMLATADVKGRIAQNTSESLSQIELAQIIAEESGCFEAPFNFPDSYTKRAYLSGRNVAPDQPLYDDSWGEVVMLSGLPGTGKDYWAGRNFRETPTISLDALRAELNIKPTDCQDEVIEAATNLAKAFLRQKQPFVWNATNLVKVTRQKLVRLFERYGARVRIVYLETDLETRASRNKNRAASVPEGVVYQMLGKTALPTPDEAQTVEWTTT